MTLLYNVLLLLSGLPLLIMSSAHGQVADIKLPPGFHSAVYAEPVKGARFMVLGDHHIVYVGTMKDEVYALLPNTNGASAHVITLLHGLNAPNGLAFYKGDLYVAEINRILRYRNMSQHLNQPPVPLVVINNLPDKQWHGYRVIHITSTGWLYITIGMPCNTCDYRMTNPVFGTISRMRLDGSQFQVYAKGIRNSMGFDWEPNSHVLWFTDNGQDYMGDNLPPDKINRATKMGLDFGFPYVYGDNILSPNYKKFTVAPHSFTLPIYNLPAHVAPLSLHFYTGTLFPADYRQSMFIAEHGSWNRSKKVGYQVILAKINHQQQLEVNTFASGWLDDSTQKVSGRPVDTLTMPDGSLLISDDFANKVYRITYQGTH